MYAGAVMAEDGGSEAPPGGRIIEARMDESLREAMPDGRLGEAVTDGRGDGMTSEKKENETMPDGRLSEATLRIDYTRPSS